jgi:hypothetical protein
MGNREDGTNPRALGLSPRQLGVSLRQLGLSQRQWAKMGRDEKIARASAIKAAMTTVKHRR